MVLVASGSLAWACGGDDDEDDDGTTTTSGGGTASDGGSGGTSPTTNGGSGGSGGSDPTTSVGGSGGTSPTTTGGGGSSTTGGGSGGEAGGGGMAGEGGADGSTGGTGGNPPTITEACTASCAAQDTSACGGDPYCTTFCEYLAIDFPACAAEAIAEQACWGELEGADFECGTGYPEPIPPNCEDEAAAYDDCVAAQEG